MTYSVALLIGAEDDLDRLFDQLLARELSTEDGKLDLPAEAVAAVRAGIGMLEKFPFTCRKADDSAFLREVVIPFGRTGYVALFEIVSNEQVAVSAIRPQREDDYH